MAQLMVNLGALQEDVENWFATNGAETVLQILEQQFDEIREQNAFRMDPLETNNDENPE